MCANLCLTAIFLSFFMMAKGMQATNPEEKTAEEYNRLGRSAAAKGNFDDARMYFLKAVTSDSSFAPAYNNLGIFFRLQGKYDESLDYFNQAEKLYLSSSNSEELYIASVYNNKGIVFKDKGDYFQALRYYNNALNIFLSSPSGMKSAAQVYNNIGIIYLIQSEFGRALEMFLKSIEIKEDYEPEDLSVAFANCAMAYAGLNEYSLAEEYTTKSIDNKIKYFGERNYKLGESYLNLAQLKILQGKDESGLEYFEKAIQLYDEVLGPLSTFHSGVYQPKGSYYLDKGQYRKALEMFQLSIISLVENFKDTSIFENPEKDNLLMQTMLLSALSFKAEALSRIYFQGGNKDRRWLIESMEVYDILAYMIEKMRGGYLDEESKLFITQNARDSYNAALIVSNELYTHTGENEYKMTAFVMAEKGKAAVLSSAVLDLQNKQVYGIPEKLQRFEKNILIEADFYDKKLYEERQKREPDTGKIIRWQSKALELSRQYDSLMTFLQDEYPDYYELKYDNKIASVEEIQSQIARNEAIIEFTMTDTLLYMFVITRNDFDIFPKNIDSLFYKSLDNVISKLKDNRFGNIGIEEYNDLNGNLHNLYVLLFSDVEPVIKNKRLIIIPDNQLGYLPFEVLLTAEPAPGEFDFKNLPYLLRSHPVSYSYSANMLIQQKKIEKGKRLNLLAFAPTYENVSVIDTGKFIASRNYKYDLVPLRFVKEETSGISSIIKGKVYQDYEATEEAFWKEASQYDVLHFAMHTLINDDNPMYSQLVFTLNNDTAENKDGLLNTYEIYNADLKARLAVLSACNTGSGKLQKGEGIMSLARGFFYAGVPGIVMTLWAVEDQSGSELMKLFYQHLSDGYEIDIALQKAKLEYLATADMLTAHPYLWSGYVNIGYNGSLYQKQKALPYLAGALGLVIILVSVFWILRQRKIKSY